jgi:hypothetical protein
MNATTATPARTAEHDANPRRGKPRGLLVNEYVGLTAADAAMSIRRAGLRPALERSLGCEPELAGQVVAQEPPAGSEIARNAIVTLYVAAPGEVPDDQRPDPRPNCNSGRSSPVAVESVPNSGAQPANPRQRQRRKPRPKQPVATAVNAVPSPLCPDVDQPELPAERESIEEERPGDPAWTVAPDDDQLPHDGGDIETQLDGLLDDELLARVDDLFAGRVDVSRRRTYPRRRQMTTPHDPQERRWQ